MTRKQINHYSVFIGLCLALLIWMWAENHDDKNAPDPPMPHQYQNK